MSLQLDARQRAMLEEMGIRLFWPEPRERETIAEAAPVAVSVRPEPVQARPPPVAKAPLAATAAPAASLGRTDVDALDWEGLQQAVADWASQRRRKAVFGTGDLRPDWLCIGDPPLEEEERQGLPFAGDAGRLLDNMLAAVGASRQRGAYLTNVLKCRLPEGGAQDADQVAESLAFLRRQVQLLQPRMVLAMGRFAVQMLLQSSEPPGRLRGTVHRYEGIPLVVTYPPASLLRTPADKAKVWADLCLAQSVLRGEPEEVRGWKARGDSVRAA